LKLQEEFSDFCFEETFSIDAFEKFYKRGVDLDWISLSRTQTELSKAIDSFKLDLVKAFVKYGANVNRPYDVGTKVPTLLDLIIYNGEHIARTAEQKKKAIEMIKTFVNAGADVDKVTSENKESEIFKRALAEMGRK